MGGFQQHGRDLPVALTRRPAPLATARAIVLGFLAIWAIRSLLVTSTTVLSEPIGKTLRTSPAAVQAQTGSGFAQSLIPLQSLLPRDAKIFLLWDGPNDEGLRDYAYFWGSYWLYPRPVTVRSSLDGLDPAKFDVLLRVVQGVPPARPELAALTPTHVLTYRGGWVITVFPLGNTGG